MPPSRAAAHYGGHSRVSGAGVPVVVQMMSAGRRGSQGEAKDVAGPASHGFVGELPPAPVGHGLNGPAVGKRPNRGLATLNSRHDGVRQLGGLMARPLA